MEILLSSYKPGQVAMKSYIYLYLLHLQYWDVQICYTASSGRVVSYNGIDAAIAS